MKRAPTLIDTLYRLTFRNEPLFTRANNAALREKFVNARRFILDARMSDFLGELASRAFAPPAEHTTEPWGGTMGATLTTHTDRAAAERMRRQIEAMRVSAMTPHAITWIEYDLRAAQTRSKALLRQPFDPSQCPEREGWLIERHPELSSAFRMHLFTWNPDPAEADSHGFQVWVFPVTFTWTIDSQQTPWPSLFEGDGEQDATVMTGLLNYTTPCASIADCDFKSAHDYKPSTIHTLLREWVGVVRRVWALLATINDLPLVYSDVRQSKGFVARGRYRRFLDHKTITINVPAKEQTKLAKNLIALVKRRAHQVRSHWRDDWRNPPSHRCPALMTSGMHQWNADQKCEICHGHRILVHEHQRGDASLGFVTHDYNVTHEVETRK